jgi:hypothetical protein
MRDSGNNISGRTVLMKGNSHGVSTMTLNLYPEQYPVDRGEDDYNAAYGFAAVHSEHTREWRLKHGVDDYSTYVGIVENRTEELYGPDVKHEQLAQKAKDESTYFPLPHSYAHCEALNTRNYTSADLGEDQPGAYVGQQQRATSDNSGIFLQKPIHPILLWF